MKIQYREIKLSKQNRIRLNTINEIIEEYQADNYTLTLRQLYYQLVSRDVIPNKQSEYAKLSTLLKEGRMGGIVDWDAIEDRLRQPNSPNEFVDTDHAMNTIIHAYELPRMRGQNCYIEVWVEKDALSGVLYRITRKYHIPILVNRGYSSASAMHDAFERFSSALDTFDSLVIIYLGDFDPSGQDMIRDIRERLLEFAELNYSYDFPLSVVPVALTKKQIEQYDPPPNPAKISDPRANKYIDEHGDSSWEVDALPPRVLNTILENKILEYVDLDLYREILREEKADKIKLEKGKDFVRSLSVDVKDEEE